MALAATLVLAGCSSDGDQPEDSPSPAPAAVPEEVADGMSTPVEDRVYPDVGDPGVDALHYDLDVDWSPDTRTLHAVETLDFRATADADSVQLDLGKPLKVAAVTLDGKDAAYDHAGKNLVVQEPVREDGEHTLVIRYAGTPRPVPAPTDRSDFDSTGWTITRDGGVWTMQEPYGAYSWYAVNDQPSDKALYSFTISTPSPGVGIANGQLQSRTQKAGDTVTRWTLDEPASSYLVTIAIGDFTMTEDESSSGIPITYWTDPDQPALLARLHEAPAALDWLEDKLGPFPFDSLGFLVVDSQSGMETQTMITLGDTRYATGADTLVHETAHQWYGDEVTPTDWRDLWMSEGMATFLQGVWTAEDQGTSIDTIFGTWAGYNQQLRTRYGPPADFVPDSFGAGNVYYIPAVMWNELRKKLGDELFWRLVREWPSAHAYGNAGYDDITSWWSEQSGEDLTDFFHDWLLSDKTPPTSP
ncbi:MAG: peptidase rane alanine aminopeptidase [Nocardioides sp.]|nr:peptidase rane alanine aminopeptidase [Nocardioides sp.]